MSNLTVQWIVIFYYFKKNPITIERQYLILYYYTVSDIIMGMHDGAFAPPGIMYNCKNTLTGPWKKNLYYKKKKKKWTHGKSWTLRSGFSLWTSIKMFKIFL